MDEQKICFHIDFLINRFLINADFVLPYVFQIMLGIEYIHQSGCAHLDLKPEKIIINECLQLQIIDFEILHEANYPESDVEPYYGLRVTKPLYLPREVLACRVSQQIFIW